MDGNKFSEVDFKEEDKFEKIVKENFKVLFGPKTLYLDLKGKVDTKSLGASIPDGFLFDFRDKENPEFYLVEAELAKHDFFNHIFPQITKFFSFLKNAADREKLIEKLFGFIKSDSQIEEEFKQYSGKKEIYKALKDIIEDSRNILIIIDENKPQFQEIMETYTDTWDKMVTIEILKQYVSDNKMILALSPDFEDLGLIEPIDYHVKEDKYTESYHTEGVKEDVVITYEKIKEAVLNLDKEIKINPQKYYISLREKKNFAYFIFRKKKLHIDIRLSYEDGCNIIKKHKLKQLSQKVQEFYNGPFFEVTLESGANIEEIIRALTEAYRNQA